MSKRVHHLFEVIMFLTIYILTVIFSWIVFYCDYRYGESIKYPFRLREKVMGLVVIPLIPVLNVILAVWILS